MDTNQAIKRAFNRGSILEALRLGPASRLSLHRQTGIRLSTVGDLVEEMLAGGLLVERGTGQRNGERGRPEQLLDLNLEGPFALGAYLDRERLRVGRVNLAGRLLESREAAVTHPANSAKLVAQLASELRALLPAGGAGHCLGAGVAVPGLLDPEAGRVVLAAAFPGLERGEPLAKRLQHELNLPAVLLSNVANAWLTAERLYGAIQGVRDAVLIILEPGQIGAAILTDGRPLRGVMESSAELGHFKIEAGGPRCECGGEGCLETFVSWEYLRARLVDKGRADLARAGAEGGLAELWTSPRGACAELRAEALARIGRAAGSLVNLTRPAVVLLAGSLAAHEKTVAEPLAAAIRRHALRPFVEKLEVRTSALGAAAGVLGGASLVLHQVFAIPEVATV